MSKVGWIPVIFTGLLLLVNNFKVVQLRPEQLLYQPSMDLSFLKDYFRNDRLVDLQMKCLFRDDGPCDFVGRWLKPRIAEGLLGKCRQCSASQTHILAAIIDYLKTNRPDFYEQAVRRYLTEDKFLELIKLANTDQDVTRDGSLDRRHIASGSPPRNTVKPPVTKSTTPAPWESYISALTMPQNSSFSFPILPELNE